MSDNWFSGTYIVENKQKYIGNKNPEYRSSWEKRVAFFMDFNQNVQKWGYEVLNIPYKFSLDKKNKMHKYITDFYAEILNNSGELIKYVIEVKPYKQTLPPVKPKIKNQKALKRYAYELNAYIKNQNKWKYAEAFCKQNGLIFKIITEKTLP